MIKEIPIDKKEFIDDLNWNFGDAMFKAPEETLQWHRTMNTLMKHIPKPIEDWEFKVLSIFTTKSIDELKKNKNMRKFKCSLGDTVDVDNSETYDYLPDVIILLDDIMHKEIGQALVYMDYLPVKKTWFPKKRNTNYKKGTLDDKKYNSGYYQRMRVYKLIKNFVDNSNDNYRNVMWFKEQIFLFQDETENMC